MEDGTTKIFLNADSQMDDVSEELKAFLNYIAGEETEDTYVKELDEAVSEAKMNREWRHEYMTLLMRDQENQEIGERKGIVEERRRIIIKMINQGLSDEQIIMFSDASEDEIAKCRE